MLSFFLLSLIVALVCSSPPLFLSNQSLSIYINTNGNSFYLIPINERCKRRQHQQSCSPKQKQRQRQRERLGGEKKVSLALSHSQFSSQYYSFLRALMMMMLFTRTCLMRLLVTRNKKTRIKRCLGCPTPILKSFSFLPLFFLFKRQERCELRALRLG